MKFFGKFSFLLLILGLLGCRKNIERQKLIKELPPLILEVKDGSGNILVFQEPPTENVVLTPDVAKLVSHLNATDKIVAASELCKSLPEYKLKRTIIAFPSLDMETLRELAPECLLTSSVYYSDEMIKILRAQGFKVFYYNVHSLEDFYTQFVALGELLENPDEAQAVVDTFKNTFQKYSESLKELNPYSVWIFTEVSELKGLPEKHILKDIVKKAGGEVIQSKDARISLEELLKKDPEFILIPAYQQQDFLDLLASHPELNSLRAVQTQRFVTYEPATYLEAKPEILIAYLELVSLLHPQALK